MSEEPKSRVGIIILMAVATMMCFSLVTYYNEVKLTKVERAIKACNLGDWTACDYLQDRNPE